MPRLLVDGDWSLHNSALGEDGGQSLYGYSILHQCDEAPGHRPLGKQGAWVDEIGGSVRCIACKAPVPAAMLGMMNLCIWER